MATKYHCDRCDREVGKLEELDTITCPHEGISNSMEKYELCKRCTQSFRDFVKPIPRIARLEEVGYAAQR